MPFTIRGQLNLTISGAVIVAVCATPFWRVVTHDPVILQILSVKMGVPNPSMISRVLDPNRVAMFPFGKVAVMFICMVTIGCGAEVAVAAVKERVMVLLPSNRIAL